MNKFSKQFINIYFAMAFVLAALSIASNDYKTAFIVIIISIFNLSITEGVSRLTNNTRSLLVREVSDVSGLSFQVAMFAVLLSVFAGLLWGLSIPLVSLFIICILSATLPIGLILVLNASLKSIAKIQKFSSPLNAVDIGSVEYIIGDHDDLFRDATPKINALMIGKDSYQVTKNGQKLHLSYKRSNNLSTSRLESMKPLLEGLFQSKNAALNSFAEEILGTEKKLSKLDYKFGEGMELLDQSRYVWDHSHVRPMSKNDRLLFAEFIKQHVLKGDNLLAISYIEKGTKHEVFMGVLSLEMAYSNDMVSQISNINTSHIKMLVECNREPAEVSAIAKKLGIKTILTSIDIEGKTDAKIFSMIGGGSVLFYGFSPLQKSKLVSILNDKKKYILASVKSSETKKTYSAADLIVGPLKINDLMSNIFAGRINQTNYNTILRSLLASSAAALACVLLGLITLLGFKIAPIITAPELLLAGCLIVLPLITLIFDSPRNTYQSAKPKDPELQLFNLVSFIGLLGFGLIAASLSYVGFMVFFAKSGISPINLTDFTLPLYHHATTVTLASLNLCTILFIFFERADSHAKVYSQYLWENKKLITAIVISFVALCLAIYTPLGQYIFGINALGVSDWLIVFGAAGIYIVIRQLQRYTRKHTRKAILQLQKELTKPIKI